MNEVFRLTTPGYLYLPLMLFRVEKANFRGSV